MRVRRVDEAADLLRDLVAIYDAGMCRAAPAPAEDLLRLGERDAAPGNDFAGRKDAEYKWLCDRFPGENADAEQVLVWGAGAPLDGAARGEPRPGEEFDGEATRLGALACGSGRR